MPSAKAPRGVGSGEGVLSPVGKFFGEFFYFLSGNIAFWCILAACFNVSIRRVKVKSKSSFVNFCVPSGQLSHVADVSSMISYTQTEQSDTHAAYTMA